MEYHGMTKTTIYRLWKTMKYRCYDINSPHYPGYGGRGITVCDRWRYSFINFYADMGDKPFKGAQLDRRDNTKGYSPENCRWVDARTNSRNRNSTINITHNGESQCITEWANRLGIPAPTLYSRVKKYGRADIILQRRML